jgi:hypothetical protein
MTIFGQKLIEGKTLFTPNTGIPVGFALVQLSNRL